MADITTWGWVHLILGSIIALTGLGLLVGNELPDGSGSSSSPSTRSCRSSGSRRAVVGVPDHHPRRGDHLPADRPLGYASSLGLTRR